MSHVQLPIISHEEMAFKLSRNDPGRVQSSISNANNSRWGGPKARCNLIGSKK